MLARARSLGFALLPLLVLAAPFPARADDAEKEGRFLKNIRQVTKHTEGEKSGEPYFSPDGKQIIYQSVRDGHPYYQIYVISVEGGEPRLLSTGKGKTTCSFFNPVDHDKFIYASTHLDERTHAAPPKEDPSKPKSYKWDYDGSFDVFEGSLKTGTTTKRLTDTDGYDAECSYSHDGKSICFTSGRDGPNAIYVMDADGKNPRRLGPPSELKIAGGGPFFMPGDKEVVYRGQAIGDPRAPMHVYVTSLDGKTTKKLTQAPRMNWCPFPHPDGKKVVYAGALDNFKNFEVFLLKTDGSFKEVRLTWNDGFDGLPSFSPDGKKLVWTSTRNGGASDVFVADFVDPPEDAYSVQTDQPEAAPAPQLKDEHGANPHGTPKGTGVIKGTELAAKNPGEIAGADHIEEFGLVQDIRWLADPEREGRRAGTFSEAETARWVRVRLQELGVAPGGLDGSYEQTFPILAGAKIENEKCRLALKEHAQLYQVDREWRPLLYSANGDASGELVFCGYGIESKEHEYDDYLSVDLKGKIAVIFTRAPRCDRGGAFGSEHPTMLEDLRYKVSQAKYHGAVGVLFVKTEGDDWLDLGFGDPGIPVGQVSRKTFLPLWAYSEKDVIQGIDLDAERKLIDETLKPRSRPMGAQYLGGEKKFQPYAVESLRVSVEKITATSRNVIGRIEGTVPGRDVIVVGAHMDHLGWGGDGSLAPGVHAIHPGADDNASGVAGMLALARALKAQAPRHTILLCAFGGEEMGLLGSAWLVKHPPINLERVEAMLNMDMIGRLGTAPLVCGGYGTAKEWPAVVETAARLAAIDISPSRDGFGPSDHASFYAKDIPVFFLFTGSHADYHKPTDTADKIDGPGIERVARFGLALVRGVDGLAARPTFEKAGADPHAQGVATGEKGPWFGSVPDYSQGDDSQDGVKLTGVRAGSPAEKAGIKAGDVIVGFDGREIKNLYDYTYAIRGAKVGKALKVVVVREGKKLELEATLVNH
jgi:hypothetical protein